ncbi:cytochrome b pre-mRNA-processing protein 3 [Novosphingobium hassiacum]|uniref:Cytochrome b pre-mRNA-processing protein 3 n=1 Tax=Novosphingobium hassiacum TaxID=173676 RepID=A0A7W5ZZ22_9SPHN|nr:ubiquinol-cytochrome C chaperone family protein [Novosphingobium hassiacum]MBB3861804.1 cytochrome b pre-mRNA-processing protein 3 [Novosphingobium hassiacum]
MSFLRKLFGRKADDRAVARPLWHRTVEIAREKEWYRDCGVADTVAGRFDMITLILSIVLIRMERDAELIEPSVRLTELFVEDMDGQLRESGVGDVVVGKRVGELMSVLGGRLGAYRDALATRDESAMAAAIGRNVNLQDGTDPLLITRRARAFAAGLDLVPAFRVLDAEIGK